VAFARRTLAAAAAAEPPPKGAAEPALEGAAAAAGAGDHASLVVPRWDEPHLAEAEAAQGAQQLAEASTSAAATGTAEPDPGDVEGWVFAGQTPSAPPLEGSWATKDFGEGAAAAAAPAAAAERPGDPRWSEPGLRIRLAPTLWG
jgi:hypothetical protein